MSNEQDAISLIKMVRDVAHNQSEKKQTVIGLVISTVVLFTLHQNEQMSNDDYSILFNATVELVKAHGRQPWHHPGLNFQYTKRIGYKMMRKEPDPYGVSSSRKTEIINMARKVGNKEAEHLILACLFTLAVNVNRNKKLKLKLSNRFVFGNDD